MFSCELYLVCRPESMVIRSTYTSGITEAYCVHVATCVTSHKSVPKVRPLYVEFVGPQQPNGEMAQWGTMAQRGKCGSTLISTMTDCLSNTLTWNRQSSWLLPLPLKMITRPSSAPLANKAPSCEKASALMESPCLTRVLFNRY